MSKGGQKRDKLGKCAVGRKSKNSMDRKQEKSGQKKLKPLYKIDGINKTVTINPGWLSARLGKNKGMTETRWTILVVLLDAMHERSNRVELTEREIAVRVEVSQSTVHRAMEFFEREDVLVMEAGEGWRISPELAWKWRYAERKGGTEGYRLLKEKREQQKLLANNLYHDTMTDNSVEEDRANHAREDQRDERRTGANHGSDGRCARSLPHGFDASVGEPVLHDSRRERNDCGLDGREGQDHRRADLSRESEQGRGARSVVAV